MTAIYGVLLPWKDRLVLSQLKLSSQASGKITVDLAGRWRISQDSDKNVSKKQQAAQTDRAFRAVSLGK